MGSIMAVVSYSTRPFITNETPLKKLCRCVRLAIRRGGKVLKLEASGPNDEIWATIHSLGGALLVITALTVGSRLAYPFL